MKKRIIQVLPWPRSVPHYTQVERELVCMCVKIFIAAWRNRKTSEYVLRMLCLKHVASG